MQVKEEARKFDRKIFWRDVREVVAALIVVGAMGGASVMAPGWVPKLGGLFAVLCIGYVVVRLLGARRHGRSIPESSTLVDRLQAEIAKVDAQIGLLNSVRSWYLWPIALGATVWMLTLVPSMEVPGGLLVAMGVITLTGAALIFGVVGVLVDRLNKQAVQTELLPYREDLDRILREARGQ